MDTDPPQEPPGLRALREKFASTLLAITPAGWSFACIATDGEGNSFFILEGDKDHAKILADLMQNHALEIPPW